MPEGDTVWRTARALDAALSGRRLVATDLRVPQLATVDLAGAPVVSTVARGKHLLTRIEPAGAPGVTLHTHLRMEGSWHLLAPGARWSRPAWTARVVLRAAEVVAVGFDLGVVELVATSAEDTIVGHLGPDLLGPDWDPAEAVRRLRREPVRTVHEALLDQRLLAGIGNMYAAELCFLSGLAPTRPVGQVPDLPRLVARARQVLHVNAQRAVQSTTGDLRERTWVYGRDGRPCRRCGTRVRRGELGAEGRERVTFWCPRCQPAPSVD